MPKDFPPIPQALLERLNEIFPDSLPSYHDFDHREVDQAFGARQVVRRLQHEYNRQNGK